jgi:hypothetical protein
VDAINSERGIALREVFSDGGLAGSSAERRRAGECPSGRLRGSEERVEELAVGVDRLVERGDVRAVLGGVPGARCALHDLANSHTVCRDEHEAVPVG